MLSAWFHRYQGYHPTGNAPVLYFSEIGEIQWQNGTIVVKTPERPEGQKSVLGLTTPKLEAVRVGFVGLGMRGDRKSTRLNSSHPK